MQLSRPTEYKLCGYLYNHFRFGHCDVPQSQRLKVSTWVIGILYLCVIKAIALIHNPLFVPSKWESDRINTFCETQFHS